MRYTSWIAVFCALAATSKFAAAQAPIPESCVTLDAPRQIANSCDFQEGVPSFGTRVRSSDVASCPREIIVEYFNPESKDMSLWVATRRGTTINTCGAGVANVRVSSKNGSSQAASPVAAATVPPASTQTPAAPDTQQRAAETPPAKPELWNAVAGSTYKIRGVVQVAIGYARNVSRDRARDNAVAQCEEAGGRTCKVTGPFNFGCLYITTGRDRGGAGWYSSATSGGATDRCRATGKKCKTPIGGCVDEN